MEGWVRALLLDTDAMAISACEPIPIVRIRPARSMMDSNANSTW